MQYITADIQGIEVAKPLQVRTKQYIIEQIRKGKLLPGQKIPTVKELSSHLNVSEKIAFLTIKNMKDDGLLDQGSDRRHVVSDAASRLFETKHLKICFSSCGADHIRHGVYQAIYNYLGNMCHGIEADILCELEMQDRSVEFEKSNFDAMVVADWEPNDFRKHCDGPAIGLDKWEGVDVDYVVSTDHFAGGSILAKHLRQKNRKKVVYWDLETGMADHLVGMTHRRLGFMKSWVDEWGHMSDLTVLPVLRGLVDQDLVGIVLEYAKKADAFFAYCDSEALRIWRILEENGIKVPDDIVIAGFDGTYEALKHDPPLTTVQQPCREIARQVLDLIVRKVLKREAVEVKEFLVAPELLVGGST